MLERRVLVETGIHFAAWIVTYVLISAIFSGDDARTAYGLLSGWWCALYAAALLRTSLTAGLVAAVVFLVLDLAAAATGLPRLYHGDGSLGIDTLLNTFQRALLFVSPILANAAVLLARRRVGEA